MTTPLEIARKISKKLAERVLVAKVKYSKRHSNYYGQVIDCDEDEFEGNSEFLLDLNLFLEGDCTLELLDFDSKEGK